MTSGRKRGALPLPGHPGLRIGARVALQRGPILRPAQRGAASGANFLNATRADVEAVVRNDSALLAGFGDGQLCGTLGTRARVMICWRKGCSALARRVGQRLRHIRRCDFASGGSRRRGLTGGREPQRRGSSSSRRGGWEGRSGTGSATRRWGTVERAGSAGGKCRRRRAERWSRGRRCRSRSGRWICARDGHDQAARAASRSRSRLWHKAPWRGCRFHPDRARSTAGPG